jgi:hypothetical protein
MLNLGCRVLKYIEENSGVFLKCKQKIHMRSKFGTQKYNVRKGNVITLKQYERIGGFIKGLTEIKKKLNQSSFVNKEIEQMR